MVAAIGVCSLGRLGTNALIERFPVLWRLFLPVLPDEWLLGCLVDRDYWGSLAATFQEDLLEIALEERAGVLEREISAQAHPRHRVADLGCGPGSLLPLLAQQFAQVVAVDYAQELLEVARSRCGARNVEFLRHDLSGGKDLMIEVEVACCVNALIDPDRKKRERMMRKVASVLKPGGTVLMVVPALESVFHVYHSLLAIRQREERPAGLSESQAERMLQGEVDSFAGGIVRVGGVRTKYWMQEEILGLLRWCGLHPQRVRRVEYSWEQEIDHAPDWLGRPYPWDWLVVGRKPKADP